MASVIQRWRGLATAEGSRSERPSLAPSLQPARMLDPDKYKLLKRLGEPGTFAAVGKGGPRDGE